MPYGIAFTKLLDVPDTTLYINACCWGGDRVTERLLGTIAGRYGDIRRYQEDWGWFIWFRQGRIALAVDVFCDDPTHGTFRVYPTSRHKRWLLPARVVDTPELEALRELVVRDLEAWAGSRCTVTRLDAQYM